MKIEMQALTKQFRKQTSLKFDASIPLCQTLALIGPSGGGKSTLLRLLAGLEHPDGGILSLDGQEIHFEEKALRQYRKNIGVVFQSWNLFPHLTALENIVLPLHRVHGMSEKEAEERSYVLLKRFELSKHADKKPYALSGGQVQRVALIRAIASDPKLVLLDEPTSALDPLMTAEVLELILELKKEQKDIVLVTHHLTFAKRMADQAVFIAEGRIIEYGSSEQLFEHPQSTIIKDYMQKVMAY